VHLKEFLKTCNTFRTPVNKTLNSNQRGYNPKRGPLPVIASKLIHKELPHSLQPKIRHQKVVEKYSLERKSVPAKIDIFADNEYRSVP